ncbi:glycerophosphoryl diester phosphodiesterase [Luteibacter sp. UNCMF331Sha3.1]|uniref:glycerophosphodiester phosphodiesterase n=1 Tax=Luteibacter sp. UNCMF331Sha3.1 TaxID=1502760 RepID=UPI0008CF7445|nr:glycerophosphodiester phosphodiesterase [Luteibacter sp. UNCMF331Sha3.1]SEM47361.1 glycerophosphoryl diester phosphodiesterase [Luteibacter sp. UNCMF331Sha3.1]
MSTTATTTPIAAKVLVIGHRGASALRPEHTLASYAVAIEDGADVVEPDLVSTRDGVLVVRHENEIGGTTDVASHPEFAARRTTKTVDGVAIAGWFTEDFTLAELKTLRARERLADIRKGNTAYDGQFAVPTFDEMIEFVAAEASARGRVIGIIPEIKHSTYFRGIGLPMEDKVLATIAAHAYTRSAPVEIQSFEVGNLKYLRGKLGKAHPNIRLLQLMEAGDEHPADAPATSYAAMMTPEGLKAIAAYADAIGPSIRSIVPLDKDGRLAAATTLVRDAHAAGLEVHPYTFRPENHFLAADFRDGAGDAARNEAGSVAEIRAYLATGIDAFFTDDPALGRRAVDGR